MRPKQKRFSHLLSLGGATFSEGLHRRPSLDDFKCTFLEPHVAETYRLLGGVGSIPKVSPGSWDVILHSCVVELDEELHFNRHRLLTLQSPVYDRLPNFPRDRYRTFWRQFESECFKAGKFGGIKRLGSNALVAHRRENRIVIDRNYSANYCTPCFHA